jgi:phosphoketolase
MYASLIVISLYHHRQHQLYTQQQLVGWYNSLTLPTSRNMSCINQVDTIKNTAHVIHSVVENRVKLASLMLSYAAFIT